MVYRVHWKLEQRSTDGVQACGQHCISPPATGMPRLLRGEPSFPPNVLGCALQLCSDEAKLNMLWVKMQIG